MDASASAWAPGDDKSRGERTVYGHQHPHDVVSAADAATAELETVKRARLAAEPELRGSLARASIPAPTIQVLEGTIYLQEETLGSEMEELKKEDCERQLQQIASIELAGQCSELSAVGQQEMKTESNQGKATDGHNMSHQETAADYEGILTDLADKIKKVEDEMLVVEEYQEYLFDVMALNRKKDCERQFEEMVIVELAGKCSELSADGKQQKTTGSNNGNATDGTLTDLADKVNSVEAEIQVCHVKNGNTESTSKDAVEEGVQASTTSESAEWGLFDRDLIITAVSSIYCPAQRAHLGCLNKWWKEVMKEVPEIPVRLLPWPIFPSTENPCYHSTVGKITYRLNLPEDIKNARFCGSFENWWFVLAWDQPRHHGDEMHHHELYHLRSNERIILPINARIGDSIHMVQMKAAVLSAPPRPLGAKYVVAAVLQVEDIQQSRVGFWQETMKEWILEPTFDLVVEDLIWHLGNLHVLTANEDVHVLFPEFDEMSAWRIDYRVQQRPTYVGDIQLATGRGGSLRRYLVESDADLMMVVKVQYINQRAEFLQVVSLNTEIEDGVAVFDENDFFRIHSGDIEDAVAGRASWDEVDYRFGRLFFVGSACSRHFHAKRNEQACIYFLDDRGIREPGTGLLLMDDTGRFLLFDRHVEAWPPTAGVLLPRASDRLPIWCIH